MISKYFKELGAGVLKKKKGAVKAKAPGKKKTGSAGGASIDISLLRQTLSRVIPARLKIDAVRPIDSTGFSPEGVDLVAYDETYPDIIRLMNGYIPYELTCGMFHVVQDLNRDSLFDVMGKVATAKKLNMFSAEPVSEDDQITIPSFAMAASTKYQMQELKNDIVNHYLSKSIEHRYEFDILMIMNKGIVVKNWREKRSFIALETKDDTFMWFFILMNEYLDVKRERSVDFRNYVKKEVVYNEY
jgi:hypothetical protein